MSIYKCVICGKQFDRVGNGVYCPGPHYRPCPVCGNPVKFHRPSEPYKCCSKECRNVLFNQSMGKYSFTKKCEICGKEFTTYRKNQKYCAGPHEAVCVICGKVFTYTCLPSDAPSTCGRDCQTLLQSKTYFDRTGYKNPSNNPDVRLKIGDSNRSDGKGGIKRTQTNNLRYNVDNVFQIPSIRESNRILQNDPEFQAHRYDDYYNRTGYKHPMEDPNSIRKQLETKGKHGPYTDVSNAQIRRRMIDPSKFNEYIEFKSDPVQYIDSHYDYPPSIDELRTALGVTDTPIYDILISNSASDYISRKRSSVEITIQKFLQSIGIDNIVPDDRTFIKPYEIDIWLPDYKVGFEYNPTQTHNSAVNSFGDVPKSSTYHLDKSNMVKSNGAFLFHIFGYDWVQRQDIIKSMICRLLGKTSNVISLKDLHIDYVDVVSSSKFFNDNHIHGYTDSDICIGLYRGAELISAMSFKQIDAVWKLVRFCEKIYHYVPNSQTILLSKFREDFNPIRIIYYSDNNTEFCDWLRTLGFSEIYNTGPTYVWSDFYDKHMFTQSVCNKNTVRSIFNDPDLDVEHIKMDDIMGSHNFFKVFGAGYTKWELL